MAARCKCWRQLVLPFQEIKSILPLSIAAGSSATRKNDLSAHSIAAGSFRPLVFEARNASYSLNCCPHLYTPRYMRCKRKKNIQYRGALSAIRRSDHIASIMLISPHARSLLVIKTSFIFVT